MIQVMCEGTFFDDHLITESEEIAYIEIMPRREMAEAALWMRRVDRETTPKN